MRADALVTTIQLKRDGYSLYEKWERERESNKIKTRFFYYLETL